MVTGPAVTCTWIGPEIDPVRDWPVVFCGRPSVADKSYCEEHVHRVYIKGSNVRSLERMSGIDRSVVEVANKDEEVQELTGDLYV